MSSIQTGATTSGVHARKDRSLVYRACTPAYATLLGAREPNDVIGRTDTALLRLSRSSAWESTQRLVLLDGVSSVAPLIAHGRAGAWMVQGLADGGDTVTIDVLSAPDLLHHLRGLVPHDLLPRVYGSAVVSPAGVVRADKSGHEWLRGFGGFASVLGQLPDAGSWQTWFSGGSAVSAPTEAVATITVEGDRCATCYCIPLRWHRQRCALIIPMSVANITAEATPGEPRFSTANLAQTLLDNVPIGTLVMAGQRVAHANATAADLLGYPSASDVCENMVLPQQLLGQLAERADGDDPLSCRWRRQDGGELQLQLSATWVTFDGLPRLVLHLDNHQPYRQQLAALTADRERFHDFAESAADFFFELDASLRFTYLSDRFESVFGMQPKDILGLSIDSFQSRYLPQPTTREWVRHLLALRTGQTQLDFEYRWVREGSNTRTLIHSCHAVLDAEGVFCGFRGVGRDITRDRELAAQVHYHATHDALTGLVNRREFERLLSEAIDGAKRSDDRHALCYVDLDHFKQVNDQAGHQAGDAVLRDLGRLFINSLRQSDVVGRLGGDEFAVLIYNCGIQKAQRLADDLRDAVVGYRLNWESTEFQVGASIGLVPINAESEDLATVMRNADFACYDAKHAGRGRISIGTDSTDPRALAGTQSEDTPVPVVREMVLSLQGPVAGDLQRLIAWPGGRVGDKRSGAGPTALGVAVVDEKQRLEVMLHWLDQHLERQDQLTLAQIQLPGAFLQQEASARQLVDSLLESALAAKLCLELPSMAVAYASDEVLAALRHVGGFAVNDDSLGARFPGQSGLVMTVGAAAYAVGDVARARVFRRAVGAARDRGLTVMVEGVSDASLLPVLRDHGIDNVSGPAISARDSISVGAVG